MRIEAKLRDNKTGLELKSRSMPSSWDECNKKDIYHIAWERFYGTPEGGEWMIPIVRGLLGISEMRLGNHTERTSMALKWYHPMRWLFILIRDFNWKSKLFYLMEVSDNPDDDQDKGLYTLIQEMDWIKEKIVLEESKLRRVGLFFGPKSGLGRMTTNEFAFASTLIQLVDSSDDAKERARHRKNLLGVIYRPFGFKFNEMHADLWAWLIGKTISERKQEAMYLNFSGVRNSFIDTYSEAFQSGGSGESKAWEEIMVGLTGDRIVDLDGVKNTDISDIMIGIIQRNEAAEELEERYRNMKG